MNSQPVAVESDSRKENKPEKQVDTAEETSAQTLAHKADDIAADISKHNHVDKRIDTLQDKQPDNDSAESEPNTVELCDRLTSLAHGLRGAASPEYITQAVETLAGGPAASNKHLTVVIGEKGRGKTTLVNRLLGASVLPIGSRSYYRTSVTLRSAAQWQIVDKNNVISSTSLPIAPELPLQAVQGPSPILDSTTLVDTPPLNEVDLDFEQRVVAELVNADAFLICVAANQLLSQNERDLIRERLLPLLGGDGALVVTHTDSLETEEDRTDIESRTRRFAGTKLKALFLPADTAAEPTDVVSFIRQSSQKHLSEQTVRWRKKVQALLRGIEQDLAVDADKQAPPPDEPSKEKRLESLMRIVQSEHALALTEAESWLREQLSSIRMNLSTHVANWTPEYAKHEGVSEVHARVQSVLRNAVRLYVSTLEKSLASGVPRSVQLASQNTATDAANIDNSVQVLQGPDASRIKEERVLHSSNVWFPVFPPVAPIPPIKDLVLPLVTVASVGLLVLAPGAITVPLAAAGLYTAHRIKKNRDEIRNKEERSEIADSLSRWIATEEPNWIEQMRKAVEPVLTGIRSKLTQIVEAAPTHRSVPKQQQLLAQTRACLELAVVKSTETVAATMAQITESTSAGSTSDASTEK